MAWLSLIPMAVACAVGAWLSYASALKTESWYVWAFALLSASTGLLFGWAVTKTGSDAEAFALSMVWDGVAAVVYVLVPVLLVGVRVPPAGWVGVGLVAAGMAVLKLSVPQ